MIATTTAISNALLTIATTSPIFTVLDDGRIMIATSTAATNALLTIATTSPIFTVLNSGHVGIGTSTPTYALTIAPVSSVTAGQTVFIQDGTPSSGVTTMVLKSGAGQSTTYLLDVQSANGTSVFAIDTFSTPEIIFNKLQAFNSNGVKIQGRQGTGTGASVILGDAAGRRLTSGTAQGVTTPITFDPLSGTGVFNTFEINLTVNQTGGSSGISRGLYVNPTLTSAYDFRALQVTSTIWTLPSSSVNNISWTLFDPPLLSMSSSTKVVSAGTIVVSGAPTVSGGVMSIASSSAIIVQAGTVVSTTNAYGIYVSAPTGATNNFAAAFLGNTTMGTSTAAASNALLTIATTSPIFTVLNNGKVGIGNSTPGSALTIVTNVKGDAIHVSGNDNLAITIDVGGSARLKLDRGVTNRAGGIMFLRAGGNGFFMGQDDNSTDHFYIGSESSGAIGTAYMVIYEDTGDIGLDIDTLYVDRSTNRVGFSTPVPSSTLHIFGTNTSTFSIANSIVAGKRYDLRVGSVASGTFDIYDFSSSTSRFVINGAGQIMIATTTAFNATSTLIVCALNNCITPTTASSTNVVAYFASTDGNTNAASIIARGSITSGMSDIGEYINVVGDESQYEAGDVLSASTLQAVHFEKSSTPYDYKLAGVVTETAGLIAGGGEDNHGNIIIALAGRVPVKVSTANGPIKIGDYLTSSDILGVAVKAIEPGPVLGMALENFDGSTSLTTGGSPSTSSGPTPTGKVMTFIDVHWALPEIEDEKLASSGLPNTLSNFTKHVWRSIKNIGITITDGVVYMKEIVAERIFAKRVVTEELCIDDTCINRDDLKALLQSVGRQGNVQTNAGGSTQPESSPESNASNNQPQPVPTDITVVDNDTEPEVEITPTSTQPLPENDTESEPPAVPLLQGEPRPEGGSLLAPNSVEGSNPQVADSEGATGEPGSLDVEPEPASPELQRGEPTAPEFVIEPEPIAEPEPQPATLPTDEQEEATQSSSPPSHEATEGQGETSAGEASPTPEAMAGETELEPSLE